MSDEGIAKLAMKAGLIESGIDQASAIESLRQRMAEYWEGRKK